MIKTNFSIRVTSVLKPYFEINLLTESFIFKGDQEIEFSLSKFDMDELGSFVDGDIDEVRFQISKFVEPDLFEVDFCSLAAFVNGRFKIDSVNIGAVICGLDLSAYGISLDFEYDEADNDEAEGRLAKLIGG